MILHKQAMLRRATLAVTLIGLVPLTAFVKAPVDFSGTYVSVPSNPKKPGPGVTITIVQTDDAMEKTYVADGKTTVSHFPLDGSAGVYTAPGGQVGKGMARWKANDLLIETFVSVTRPDGPTIHFHEKEKWQLSPDRKTLKIRVETESPDMPADIVSAAIPAFTATYTRVEQP